MTRIVTVALAAVLLIGGAGCASAGVTVYGDSLVAKAADWGSGNPVAYSNAGGDAMAAAFTTSGDPKISEYGWFSEPGKTLTSHSKWRSTGPALDTVTSKPQVVVYSFGTNDGAVHATSSNGTPTAQTAASNAQKWIDAAYAQGAKCVIWILPNNRTTALATDDQRTRFFNFMNAFANALREKDRDQGKLYLVDWPAIYDTNPGSWVTNEYWLGNTFDGLHPNKNGGAAIGNRIKAIAGSASCTVEINP
jgi:lysophospholipase L1-like esterase